MPYTFMLPALITVLSLIMYLVFIVNVGKARSRFDVKAPAISGNPDFERYYRVQMNTLETLVIFIPSLWLFTFTWQQPYLGLALGIVWIIGRIMYAMGYYKEASSRAMGYYISSVALLILLVGALIGIIKDLMILH